MVDCLGEAPRNPRRLGANAHTSGVDRSLSVYVQFLAPTAIVVSSLQDEDRLILNEYYFNAYAL
jgi:hypothetical protein